MFHLAPFPKPLHVRPRRRSWRPRFVLGSFLLLALGGCATVDKSAQRPRGPGFVPTNVYRPSPAEIAAGPTVRRVALLPVHLVKADPSRLEDLDNNFRAELTRTGHYEIVRVSRPELAALCGRTQVDSTEALSAGLLDVLRVQYGVDAILFTDITNDNPYRPVSLGVRARLVHATSGAVLWAADNLFDSGNPTVANSARRYELDQQRQSFPLDRDGGAALLSPDRFSRYAANATFATLPSLYERRLVAVSVSSGH